MMHWINETLQWVFLIALATPTVARVVRDFRAEEEDDEQY